MENPIYQLLYVSAAKQSLNAAEMLRILEQSRTANQQRNITGILLYCEGSIIQLLEGDESTVESLFQTISADQRHDNVQRLYSHCNAHRHFPDWSMGYEELPEAALKDNIYDFDKLADHQLSREQLDAISHKINTLMQTFQADESVAIH